MRGHLTEAAGDARAEQFHRRATQQRQARAAVTYSTPAQHPEAIVIRRARPADQGTLRGLAELDSAQIIRGYVLIAEVDGDPRAAIDVATGVAIANPFAPTAHLVELLQLRAARLRDPDMRTRRRVRLRRRSAYRTA